MRDLLISVGVILVLINLAGSRVLFKPISQCIDTGTGFEEARDRIRVLPAASAIWAALLVSIHMFGLFYLHHARFLTYNRDTFYLVIYPALLIILFSILMGLFIYFVIGNFTSKVREEFFYRFGDVITPGSGTVLRKMAIAFFAVTVIPVTIVFLRIYLFPHHAHFELLDSTQIEKIYLSGVVFLSIIAFIFVGKNFARPLNLLEQSMHRIGRGELQARTPVLTDDELGRLTVGFNSMAEKLENQADIGETFGKFLPDSIVPTVLKDKGVVRPQLREATILFSDIEGFTTICESLKPDEIVAMLNEYFTLVAEPIREFRGVITQFQGDAVLASFNLPVEDKSHAANAVNAAIKVQKLISTHKFVDGVPLKTRIGLHTGPVVGGTVGDGVRLGYTVHGDTVNVAARLEQMNKECNSSVLVSERTVMMAGSDFNFKEVGQVLLRGRKEPVRAFEVLF
ncbi:MAG: adenylate/guanylate cyclase domain-containing protein [Phycisphaerae bacterium]|nr:adenylate/guanylate cyclase domain-containing protein [Phycisphaerae bacterium]NIP50635.1 adenylate/guanylate cyclase domain-containing protein [Phycisphaerae bacterium]NIW96943.1 HAMP domain-containing protein [Phycisphaerae bacterium]NIX26355.1 HAMP domain-containing protein [Phycisphaerae bacterium]